MQRPIPRQGHDWQFHRLTRAPAGREPFMVGLSALDDPHWGLAAQDGTLPHPRTIPVQILDIPPVVEMRCGRCPNRPEAKPASLKRLADRKFAQGEKYIYLG